MNQGIIDISFPDIGVMGEVFITKGMAELKVGFDLVE